MTLPLWPVWAVDLVGSGMMIVISFGAVQVARQLRTQDRQNVVWTYLLWLCYALAGFAVSRSIGHIAKRLLITSGQQAIWKALQPFSGSINSIMFMVVASITLFFERIWGIYQQILLDREALQEAHRQLVYVNQNLEHLITDRTRELAESERKYRRLFEVSRDLIMMVDPDSRILDMNPAGAEMLGLQTQGLPPGELRFTDFLEDGSLWMSLSQALQDRGFLPDTEIVLQRRGGGHCSVLISGALERRVDGLPGVVHFLGKDITQRKTLERQLLQADKLASIGQLAAGIAHEVNNPLSMILGYTQLLLRSEPEGTQQQADLKIIEKHARTCKTIVQDLLSFSRSTRTRKGVGDIHQAIDEVIKVVQHQFRLDGLAIETEFDRGVPAIVMDQEKLRQVLMNLIMNARHAIGREGVIRVVTRLDTATRRVRVEVSDTGCGIEPQHLPRIFDPFFTTKPTGEGTGLGLSVSYGIVKDHGGEIQVESVPGRGSKFTIVLPADSGETIADE